MKPSPPGVGGRGEGEPFVDRIGVLVPENLDSEEKSRSWIRRFPRG
jgi:hypothetical protein